MIRRCFIAATFLAYAVANPVANPAHTDISPPGIRGYRQAASIDDLHARIYRRGVR